MYALSLIRTQLYLPTLPNERGSMCARKFIFLASYGNVTIHIELAKVKGEHISTNAFKHKSLLSINLNSKDTIFWRCPNWKLGYLSIIQEDRCNYNTKLKIKLTSSCFRTIFGYLFWMLYKTDGGKSELGLFTKQLTKFETFKKYPFQNDIAKASN